MYSDIKSSFPLTAFTLCHAAAPLRPPALTIDSTIPFSRLLTQPFCHLTTAMPSASLLLPPLWRKEASLVGSVSLTSR